MEFINDFLKYIGTTICEFFTTPEALVCIIMIAVCIFIGIYLGTHKEKMEAIDAFFEKHILNSKIVKNYENKQNIKEADYHLLMNNPEPNITVGQIRQLISSDTGIEIYSSQKFLTENTNRLLKNKYNNCKVVSIWESGDRYHGNISIRIDESAEVKE